VSAGPRRTPRRRSSWRRFAHPTAARERGDAQQELDAIDYELRYKPTETPASRLAVARKERADAEPKVRPLEQDERRLSYAESEACVDSELSLLWWDKYGCAFLPNPLYWQAPEKFRAPSSPS
jgi:hypothetical protein